MTCAECGTELVSGARYCHACGEPVDPRASPVGFEADRGDAPNDPPSSSNLPWYIAGAALVALLFVVLVPRFSEERDSNPLAPQTSAVPITGDAGAMGGAMGDATGVDLSSMTPREAADRLWTRVLRAISSGDNEQAATFLPMALGAYERVDSLGVDGNYRVSFLHLAAGNTAAARMHAQAILDDVPTHLFGFFMMAQALEIEGERDAAVGYYEQFLEHYDEEYTNHLERYGSQQNFLPIMREETVRRLDAS